MSFKNFLIGLVVSFGLAWLFLVVVPFVSMARLKRPAFPAEKGEAPSEFYRSGRTGQVAQGSEIYGQEGCYYCHTQLVRPTFAGNDLWRADWAGLRKSAASPVDTRRATTAFDFDGEAIAHIGMARIGPDLSNFGRRLESRLAQKKSSLTPQQWVLLHLYNPRLVPGLNTNSICPPKKSFFETQDAEFQRARRLPLLTKKGQAIVPKERAEALASYLLSLKKDTLGNPLPPSLDHSAQEPGDKEVAK